MYTPKDSEPRFTIPEKRKAPEPAGPTPDVWKPHKPGMEINQRGELKTTDKPSSS